MWLTSYFLGRAPCASVSATWTCNPIAPCTVPVAYRESVASRIFRWARCHFSFYGSAAIFTKVFHLLVEAVTPAVTRKPISSTTGTVFRRKHFDACLRYGPGAAERLVGSMVRLGMISMHALFYSFKHLLKCIPLLLARKLNIFLLLYVGSCSICRMRGRSVRSCVFDPSRTAFESSASAQDAAQGERRSGDILKFKKFVSCQIQTNVMQQVMQQA